MNFGLSIESHQNHLFIFLGIAQTNLHELIMKHYSHKQNILLVFTHRKEYAANYTNKEGCRSECKK